MKKLLACMAFAALVFTAATAQSADKVSEILQTDSVTWGQASYLALTAREGTRDTISEQEALGILQSEGYAPQTVSAEDFINLQQIAFVCSSTWDIKGSLWLKIKPSARYSLRQLKADGIVNSKYDPSKSCSGRELLGIISKCIDTYGIKTTGGAQ